MRKILLLTAFAVLAVAMTASALSAAAVGLHSSAGANDEDGAGYTLTGGATLAGRADDADSVASYNCTLRSEVGTMAAPGGFGPPPDSRPLEDITWGVACAQVNAADAGPDSITGSIAGVLRSSFLQAGGIVYLPSDDPQNPDDFHVLTCHGPASLPNLLAACILVG